VDLRNPFSGATYPLAGDVVAVIDSGYEGFSAVPSDIFKLLMLDELKLQKRSLILANGTTLSSKGTYAILNIPYLRVKLNGFVETYDGLEEIIIGVQALSRFKSTFDYCSKRVKLEPCP
jgi:clan AA aspartic protease